MKTSSVSVIGVLVVALFLSLCAGLRAEGYQGSDASVAPLRSGSSSTLNVNLADRLNARYLSALQQCADGSAALTCSGVILRNSVFSTGFDFWTHSPAAQRLGSVSFSYVRSDFPGNPGDIHSGFIFMDEQQVAAVGKMHQNARCIYPFITGTQVGNRPLHGCGFAESATVIDATVDESTCGTLVVPAVTASLWIENFQRLGSDTRKQCSLSTRVPEQFIASLNVRGELATLAAAHTNELLLSTWDEQHPETLPIEAFFYNVTKNGARQNALKLQDAYHAKTGIFLPLVEIDFSAADRRVFTQQLPTGDQVVAQLRARYSDTRNNCGTDSEPAFLCSGILMRGTERSDQFDPWNPSPVSVNNGGISFTFLRSDYKVKRLAYNYASGFIFASTLKRDGSDNIAPPKYKYQVLCFFPVDGSSNARPDGGCGPHPRYPTASVSCERQPSPVTTGEQWMAHFTKYPVGAARTESSCAFNVRESQGALAGPRFHEGMRGGSLVSPAAFDTPNDTKIATWAQNIPAQLPIEAFMYVLPAGLDEARDYQRRYRQATEVTVPIIQMSLPQRQDGEVTFAYREADQN